MYTYVLFAVAPLHDESAPSATEQEWMESLVRNTELAQKFRAQNSQFRSIAEWQGVHLSADGFVQSIDFSKDHLSTDELVERAQQEERHRMERNDCMHYGGEWHCPFRSIFTDAAYTGGKNAVQLSYIPRRTRVFRIFLRNLHGKLEASELPEALIEIHLGSNRFQGSVDISQLPRDLQVICLQRNLLSGALHLQHLPEPLEKLNLSENDFSGGICLRKLPAALRELNLARNTLFGPLDLSALPDTLSLLYLENNCFCQPVDLRLIPSSMQVIDLRANAIRQEFLFVRADRSHSCQILFDAKAYSVLMDTNGRALTAQPVGNCF